MGFARKFENRMEDSLEGVADRMSNAPISPVKIAKKAEKQMQREKMVGAGKQYAPTLYTVLVNAGDDARLFGYYPTLAGETETYLAAKAEAKGLIMDGQPLVRFIADDTLKPGKFDVIAEAVAAPVIEQLRLEEMQRYGISPAPAPYQQSQQGFAQPHAKSDYFVAPRATANSWNDDYAYEPNYGNLGNEGYGNLGNEGYGNLNNEGFNEGFAASQHDAPSANQEPPQTPSYGNLWDEQQSQPARNEEWFADPAFASVPAPQPQASPMPQPAAQPAAPAVAPATMVMGAARPNAQAAGTQTPLFAKLVNISTGQTHILRSSRTVIGRGTSCDVMLADLNASRTHAEIRCEPQGFWSLTDLNSTNGTVVNGRRIASTPLKEGDVITIGISNLAFSLR